MKIEMICRNKIWDYSSGHRVDKLVDCEMPLQMIHTTFASGLDDRAVRHKRMDGANISNRDCYQYRCNNCKVSYFYEYGELSSEEQHRIDRK